MQLALQAISSAPAAAGTTVPAADPRYLQEARLLLQVVVSVSSHFIRPLRKPSSEPESACLQRCDDPGFQPFLSIDPLPCVSSLLRILRQTDRRTPRPTPEAAPATDLAHLEAARLSLKVCSLGARNIIIRACACEYQYTRL